MSNLAKARESIGITQKQLAEALGYKQTRISNYECNIRTPKLRDARRIVNKLNELGANVSLDSIFPD